MTPPSPKSAMTPKSTYWIKTFAEHSTIHGILDLYQASNRTKLGWIIILLLAFAMAANGCYSIVAQYIARPMGITYVRGDLASVKLPDIIICPFSRFNKLFFENHSISEELADYIESGFMGVPVSFYGLDPSINDWNDDNNVYETQLRKVLMHLNMTMLGLINSASHSCDSIIRYCRTPYKLYDCCSSEHVQYELTMQGRCLRIGGIPQEMGGYGSGMTIGLRLPYENYHQSRNTFHNNGTLIALVDQGIAMGSNIFMIPDGVHVLLPVRITEYKFTNDPPRYFCRNVAPDVVYSPIQCFDDCIMRKAKSICGCTMWHLPDTKYPYCTPSQLYDCLMEQINTSFLEFAAANMSLSKSCRSNCTQPCSYKEHTSSVSYTQFPSDTLSSILSRRYNINDFRSDIIIDYFYDKLEFTLIEHIPSMSINQLIGNLGGQLGLWIGASLVSLIQILTFGFNICAGGVPQTDYTENIHFNLHNL